MLLLQQRSIQCQSVQEQSVQELTAIAEIEVSQTSHDTQTRAGYGGNTKITGATLWEHVFYIERLAWKDFVPTPPPVSKSNSSVLLEKAMPCTVK